MQFINSRSLAPDVNDWLTNTRHPRILHIFDRACNLINERREVLSVVTPQIGNGPFNLVIDADICFSKHLRFESKISTSQTQLHLGDWSVHIANPKIWNPYPDWEGLRVKKSDITTQLAKLRLTNYQLSDSLVSNLSSSLAIADLHSSLLAGQKLAGLGVGLTPSGDDFIMGAIFATWIIHPLEIARVLAQEITNTAAPLTTSLSAAWLRSAGKGEAGILWHEFFDALVSSDPPRIQKTIKRILDVGETSGADALAGFTGVFMSWIQTTGSSHG